MKKTQRTVQQTKKIDWQYTPDEIGALWDYGAEQAQKFELENVRKLTITHPTLGWAGNVLFNKDGICWNAAPVWSTFIGLTVAECRGKAIQLSYTVK